MFYCVLRSEEFRKFVMMLDSNAKARVARDYVVHWFIKKSQKTPLKELKTALKRLTEI